MESRYVGIDVSKGELEVVVWPTKERRCFVNQVSGCELLSRWLVSLTPTLAVVEATGGLERPLVTRLWMAGVVVAVVNPRQVRDFAKALGRLAKTDALDALVLAQFAEAVQPQARPLKEASTQELEALVMRRRQLVEMITAEQNRLSSALPGVQGSIREQLNWLRKQLATLDDEMWRYIKGSPIWCEKVELLLDVKGVGPVLCATVLALLPELGQLSRRQVSALAAVCPFNRESGRWRGRPAIFGGRAQRGASARKHLDKRHSCS